MSEQEILDNLNNNKVRIIEILTRNNWQFFKYYFLLSEKYLANNLDDEFKVVFSQFYVMNGPMGLNDLQKNEFFRLLSVRENSLGNILRSLHSINGYKNSHKLYLSFATKLLHTIDNNLPIYDRNIASILDLPVQTSDAQLEEKIKNRLEIYTELEKKFSNLLNNIGIKNTIDNFRNELRSKAVEGNFIWQDNLIKEVKILDSLLWAMYSV